MAAREDDGTGLQLRPSAESSGEIDALATLLGGRVGLGGVLTDLGRQARPSRLGRLLGRAVDSAYRWDGADARDPRWWPQGISSSADAEESEKVDGRRLLMTTWYAKDLGSGSHGSRVSVVDLESLRYEHVLLVEPTVDEAGRPTARPLLAHAGGLVWRGRYLHVAATTRGFWTCLVDDILPATGDEVAAFGHRYLLPVRLAHRAHTAAGRERFRYSFLSLDRSTDPPGLLVGEYGRRGATTRLARFDLSGSGLPVTDAAGIAHASRVQETGVNQMQGAVTAGGRTHVTSSRGSRRPGSVYAGSADRLREHRFAVPMGPEDTTYWPSTDHLWTVTEHPRRRWLVSLPRARFA